MEEILASIRRIIADDDHEPVRRPVARRADALSEAGRPEAARADATRADTGRADAARPVVPRPEGGRQPVDEARVERVPAERARLEGDRAFASRLDPVRADVGGVDGSRHDAPRPVTVRPAEGQRPDPVRVEPQRPAVPRPDPVRTEVVRAEPPRVDAQRQEPQRPEAVRADGYHRAPLRPEAGVPDAVRTALRADPARADIARSEMVRPEPVRIDPSRRDAGRAEEGPAEGPASRPVRFDPVQSDAVRLELERPVPDTRRQRDERWPFAGDAEAFASLYESEGSAALARDAPVMGVAPAPPQEAPRPTAHDGLDARPARPVTASDPRRKDLLSPAVDAAVMAAFESLGDVSVGQASLPQQGRTVEDLIKEILRPMLKTWLDDHLPDIVERLVRAEIERVARHGR